MLPCSVKELISLAKQEGTDDKMKTYLEGSHQLMKLVSDAGTKKVSPIISLREDKNKMAFFFFAREFLPFVVKRLYFRQNKLENLLSDFVTVSDEAFTLFLLENNVARWEVMFENGTTKSDESMPTQKYQATGGADDNKNGKDGYGVQAALRYNEYYKYVSEARSKTDTNSLETELLRNMEDLENDDGGKKRKTRNKRKRDGELNYVDDAGKPIKVLCDL